MLSVVNSTGIVVEEEIFGPGDEPDDDPILDPEIIVVVLFVAIPTLGGILSSAAIFGNSEWYNGLKKPKWAPPSWTFCSVWLVMYMLSGLGAYLVYSNGEGALETGVPICCYVITLLLQWIWTPIFFVLKEIKHALYDLVLTDISFIITTGLYLNTDEVAAYLMIPFLLWLVMSTTLNYVILLPRYEGFYSNPGGVPSNLYSGQTNNQVDSGVNLYSNLELPPQYCSNCQQERTLEFDRF